MSNERSWGITEGMRKTPRLLIEHKRDGGEHSPEEIHLLIQLFLQGQMTDYQMSAWLMASYLRGLSTQEMVALTEAMLHSGTRLRWKKSAGLLIDKHSTGGVGDKLSLPLAPLVACCGLAVPMISGRGLGHTGGTLDKLESIPGYQTRLSTREFQKIVEKIGVSLIGQTEDIAPADRRIYALRDVTGTVAYRPLIVASILSKKLAAGLHGLVLDVKTGRGAFMKSSQEARRLAQDLVQVATQLGTVAVARLTNMNTPLGATIGNALEVRESLEVLQGRGPDSTRELTLLLGEEMLLVSGLEKQRSAARKRLLQALDSGAALERFAQMIELHSGDPRVTEDPKRLPQVSRPLTIEAPRSGVVHSIDPLHLAELTLSWGAGRRRAEDPVDPAVGLEILVQVGQRVERGQPLARAHVRKKSAELSVQVLSAFQLQSAPCAPEPWVLSPRILARSSPTGRT